MHNIESLAKTDMKKFEIISKKQLAPNVHEYVIYAPMVAKHCLAGQFIILRTDENGERVPFTIATILARTARCPFSCKKWVTQRSNSRT